MKKQIFLFPKKNLEEDFWSNQQESIKRKKEEEKYFSQM